MPANGVAFNHAEIIDWLRIKTTEKQRCERRTIKVYERLEDTKELRKRDKAKEIKKHKFAINLPIDLILEEGVKERTESGCETFFYYTIFFVISSKPARKDSKDWQSLENKIIYYKFFLSHFISSKRLKIIVVSPHWNRIKHAFKSNSHKNAPLLESGIGFWELKSKEENPVVRIPPLSLRDQMHQEYGEKKREYEEKKHQDVPFDVPLVFDRYIHDAVDAILDLKPEDFSGQYIERKLIPHIFHLSEISYREKLSHLLNEYLTEKSYDYEAVSEIFSLLWKDCIGLHYTDFLEKFEPCLQSIFPLPEEKDGYTYRDHYVHQFQVFLLGLIIMDTCYSSFKMYSNPELSWLIASSLHDTAYPIEEYDEWTKEFFKMLFSAKEKKKKDTKNILMLELKNSFVDDDLLSCMGYIICNLCSSLLTKEGLKANWLADKSELVKYFYNETTAKRSHGIVESISFLRTILFLTTTKSQKNKKQVEKIEQILGKRFQDAFDEIFVCSAQAIALHDIQKWPDAFKQACQKSGAPEHSSWENESDICLEFELDPLSFLLIFCDTVQEWGRPAKSKSSGISESKDGFYLKDFACSIKKVAITLGTREYTVEDKTFKDKQSELEKIQCLLRQPQGTKFTIRLEDRNGKPKDYAMFGARAITTVP